MAIYNNYQDINLDTFKDAEQHKSMCRLIIAEINAIANPGKAIKVVAGMYMYLPVNGNEIFTISKLDEEYGHDKGLWEIESAKLSWQRGDYDLTNTLKEALINANRTTK